MGVGWNKLINFFSVLTKHTNQPNLPIFCISSHISSIFHNICPVCALHCRITNTSSNIFSSPSLQLSAPAVQRWKQTKRAFLFSQSYHLAAAQCQCDAPILFSCICICICIYICICICIFILICICICVFLYLYLCLKLNLYLYPKPESSSCCPVLAPILFKPALKRF